MALFLILFFFKKKSTLTYGDLNVLVTCSPYQLVSVYAFTVGHSVQDFLFVFISPLDR